MDSGWAPFATKHETAACGGYGVAQGQMRPDSVVVHTMEGRITTLRTWAAQRPAVNKASYHFGLGLDGSIDQYVSIFTPAWHAGRVDAQPPTWPMYRGVNPNSHSIGISAEGFAGMQQPQAWTTAQCEAAVRLLLWIETEAGITLDARTLGEHSQIAVLSRSDPGTRWPKADILRALRPTAIESNAYIVSPGDTLGRIAGRFRVTVGDLVAWNGISDPNRVEVGQVLRLSAAAPVPNDHGAARAKLEAIERIIREG
jgi:N-acetyl-anhydromuramyl-L-alanine amidase AmpD